MVALANSIKGNFLPVRATCGGEAPWLTGLLVAGVVRVCAAACLGLRRKVLE